MITTPSENSVSWLWTEQLSTYRFWGLVLFGLLSGLGGELTSFFLGILLNRELGLASQATMERMGWIISIGQLSSLYVVWVVSRWRAKHLLIAAGSLQATGTLLMIVPTLTVPLLGRYLGGALFGMGISVVMLGTLAVLAGGRGRMETFVVALGVIVTLQNGGNVVFPYLAGEGIDRFGLSSLVWIALGLELLGLLALLPANPSFFTEPPPSRNHTFPPIYRSPATVWLKCLIPFYWLYWLHRIHGEVMAIAPSRRLLSPSGAVATAVVPFLLPVGFLLWFFDLLSPVGAIVVALAPFMAPIMMATIADALNGYASEHGEQHSPSSRTVFWLSILCLPAAVALIQGTVNRTASRGEQIPQL